MASDEVKKKSESTHQVYTGADTVLQSALHTIND